MLLETYRVTTRHLFDRFKSYEVLLVPRALTRRAAELLFCGGHGAHGAGAICVFSSAELDAALSAFEADRARSHATVYVVGRLAAALRPFCAEARVAKVDVAQLLRASTAEQPELAQIAEALLANHARRFFGEADVLALLSFFSCATLAPALGALATLPPAQFLRFLERGARRELVYRCAAQRAALPLSPVHSPVRAAVESPLRARLRELLAAPAVPRNALIYAPRGCNPFEVMAGLRSSGAAVTTHVIDAASFLCNYVGEGEAKLKRALAAEAAALPVVKWIRNADLLIARGASHATMHRLRTTLLTELDGLTKTKNASTTYVAVSSVRAAELDAAATRPGRFDVLLDAERGSCAAE